jgi:poly(A)-specific ribonuclease
MGFTLVVEELIKCKKPIIGHNMIYDIIYLYNQFIDDLPLTYLEFIQKWNSLFPLVYDNKVLSCGAEYFGRTDLGKVYEKCLNDEKIKGSGMNIAFDLRGGFGNYDGTELLSHYHEAAYDAYMTGFAFANILKFKEYDKGKP